MQGRVSQCFPDLAYKLNLGWALLLVVQNTGFLAKSILFDHTSQKQKMGVVIAWIVALRLLRRMDSRIHGNPVFLDKEQRHIPREG